MAETAGPARRQFYSLPASEDVDLNGSPSNDSSQCTDSGSDQSNYKDSFLQYISDNVIGADKTFSGPFGLRKVTYLDFVASGRALNFIEDYIRLEVLPEYGNTHTTTSVTSLQTTLFRHEARDILRNRMNASEHDSVIFSGSGSTGAVHKLIHALNLEQNPSIVLVGPYEHHSNILPWKEAGAEVIRIHQTETGHIDMNHLEVTLKAHQGDSRQLIGAFSAASNVTGVLTDVDAVTICLHKHKALAVWDYACAAPYVKLDMNPYIGGSDQQYVYKDAVFLSIHKFVGGISTPGVLIAKKKLFKHPVPEGCGGGTVFFVRRDNHRYLQEPESKEEGGTPAIVQSIRAGLVVQLREAVGLDVIYQKDQWLLSQAQAAWSDCPELVQLGPRPGPQSPDKLPIFSFLVLHKQTGRFLHHNFVAAVLNDVFGIQARGGCACAGPYAMDLLGLDEKMAQVIEELIAEDSRLDRTHLRRIGEYSHREILRPGFVRLNLPYFMDNECLQFVLEAVRMTAEHAWRLLPQYLFNPETAEWRQRHFQTFKDRKWLGHISYRSGQMKYHQPKQNVKGPLPTSYQDCLLKGKKLFEDATKLRLKIPDQSALFDEEASRCRWFVLPSEANACLLQQQGVSTTLLPAHVAQDKLPFFPGRDVRNKAKSEKDPTKSDPSSHSEAESASNKNGGMLALQSALRYADSILKSSGTNKMSETVDGVMNGIWQNFDPKSPNYAQMKESKHSGNAMKEVTDTINQIWESSTVKDGKNSSSVDYGRNGGSHDVSSSAHASDNTQIVSRPVNETEKAVNINVKSLELEEIESQLDSACSENSKSMNNALDVINNGLQQIWDGFAPEKLTSKAELNKEKENGEACKAELEEIESQLDSACSENSKSMNNALDVINNGLQQIWDGFAPEKTTRVAELNKEKENGEACKAEIGVSSKSEGTVETNSKSTLDEVSNVMNGIWKSFLPQQEKEVLNAGLKACDSENNTHDVTASDSCEDRQIKSCALDERKDTESDKVSEVTRSMQGIWDHFAPTQPTEVRADTKDDSMLPGSIIRDDTKSDKVSEVTRSMQGIWDHFAPTQPTEVRADTKDDSMLPGSIIRDDTKSDKVSEVTNAMQGIRDHFATTKSSEVRADTEDDSTLPASVEKDDTDSDKVSEVTNAMQGIWDHFAPSKPTEVRAGTKDDSTLPGSKARDDTKSDKVSEVTNTMQGIWDHFAPGKLTDAKVNTQKEKTLSSIMKKESSESDNVAKISRAMTEIRENFALPKINSDDGKILSKPVKGNDTERSAMLDPKTNVNSECEGSFHRDENTPQHYSANSSQQLAASQPSFSQGMIKALDQGFGELTLDEDFDVQARNSGESNLPPGNLSYSAQFSTMVSGTLRSEDTSSMEKKFLPSNQSLKHLLQPQEELAVRTSLGSPISAQDHLIATDGACPFNKRNGKLPETEDAGPSKGAAPVVQWFSPPKQIFKPTVTALEEYGMLREGDKVLVCLSGGKDSLSLLHTIRQYQFYAKGNGIQFEFGAVTVDPMTPSYDPSPLKQYLASLGVPYFYESQCILETAEQLPYECASICSFCSRMKRGRIYAAARREGYNVLALGQHLDDLAESFLMSLFHNGNLNTMKAHYTIKQGDLRVIRPFVYVREADLRAFAEQRKLPIIAENCPACFEAPKERHRTKQLLAAQEVMFPQVYSSMMAALRPLMARGVNVKTSLPEDDGDED